MATVPNGVSVSMQYEHLHTILYNTFLSVSVSVSGVFPKCFTEFAEFTDKNICHYSKRAQGLFTRNEIQPVTVIQPGIVDGLNNRLNGSQTHLH